MQSVLRLSCVLLPVFALSVDSAAFAKPAKKKKATVAETKDDDQDETQETPAKDERLSTGYGIGGSFTAYYAGGQGIGVDAWKQAPELQYGLHFLGTAGETVGGGEEKDDEGTVLKEAVSIDAYTLQGKVRKFFGGSFYLTAAFGYTAYSGEYGFEIGDSETKVDYEGGAGLFTFGLGNQWTLDSGLVIGCDWIGLGALVGPSVEISDSEDRDAVDSGTRFFFNSSVDERVEETMTKMYGAYALLLTVGQRL